MVLILEFSRYAETSLHFPFDMRRWERHGSLAYGVAESCQQDWVSSMEFGASLCCMVGSFSWPDKSAPSWPKVIVVTFFNSSNVLCTG